MLKAKGETGQKWKADKGKNKYEKLEEIHKSKFFNERYGPVHCCGSCPIKTNKLFDA